MFKPKFFLMALICALTLLFSPIGLGGALAQSSCKGQSNSACSSSSKCAWVKAFTRSDGAKVKAHCRAKAGGGSTKKTSAKKKSDTKKTAKKDTKKKDTKKKEVKKKVTKKKTDTKKKVKKKKTNKSS